MTLRLGGPMRLALLQVRSGLSRPTVLKGIAQLTAAGWCVPTADGQTGAIDRAPSDCRVTMPAGLVTDPGVGARARVLYGVLQLTPHWRSPSGQFTYPGLSALAHAGRNTVRRAVEELVDAGWLRINQAHVHAPVHFWPGRFASADAQVEADRARQRLAGVRYKGETLMREFLSLLVDSEEFEDNAAPGFLVNPATGERMQLDRFYPPSVAFEYNGPQHYGATGRFTARDVARQRARDYMKMGICLDKGITLVIVHAHDLSLEGMKKKIGQLLPLRDPQGHEPLKAFLASVSRKYRRKADRERRADLRQPEDAAGPREAAEAGRPAGDRPGRT